MLMMRKAESIRIQISVTSLEKLRQQMLASLAEQLMSVNGISKCLQVKLPIKRWSSCKKSTSKRSVNPLETSSAARLQKTLNSYFGSLADSYHKLRNSVLHGGDASCAETLLIDADGRLHFIRNPGKMHSFFY